MRITFDPAARADLDDIFAWSATENEAAAHEMLARIEARVALLAIRASSTWDGRVSKKARAS
jgi:plasmid stabilization system protein ParE